MHMAARNRKTVGSSSDDVDDVSERAARNGRRIAQDVSEQTSTATLAAFDAFNGPIAKVLDHNRLMFQKMMHVMRQESLHFVNRRLEHAGRALESSRDCHGVMGLVAVQQEYLMEMARDYAEQARRLADLVQDLGADGASEISEASEAISESARHSMRRAAQQSARL
jgi:hypothetical protein